MPHILPILAVVLPALATALAVQEPAPEVLPPVEVLPFPDLRLPLLRPDGSLSPELHGLGDWRGRKILLVQFASW